MSEKTKTAEIRSLQNLEIRKWKIRFGIFLVFACAIVTLVSTMKELGLSGKTSVNLGFANIEVNTGESEKLSSAQQQQVENKAQEPIAQSFNTNAQNQSGYCQYEYGSYSFVMYPNVPYGPSNLGYYISTSGYGQFGVMDPYGTFTGVSARQMGQWQWAINGSDIEICADTNGSYARFDY